MLEEKSIYLIFEYAEHDFLVRSSRMNSEQLVEFELIRFSSHLFDPPLSANHSPSFIDQNLDTNCRTQIASMATSQRRCLPARQLDYSS